MGYFSEKELDLQYEVEDDGMVFDRKQRNYLSGYAIPDDKVKLKGESENGNRD